MNANEFWKMLNEFSKEKAEEILSDYAGSDGIIGRIFELYEESANAVGLTVEEYLEEISPDKYVDYCYEAYIDRQHNKNL